MHAAPFQGRWHFRVAESHPSRGHYVMHGNSSFVRSLADFVIISRANSPKTAAVRLYCDRHVKISWHPLHESAYNRDHVWFIQLIWGICREQRSLHPCEGSACSRTPSQCETGKRHSPECETGQKVSPSAFVHPCWPVHSIGNHATLDPHHRPWNHHGGRG